MKKEMFLVVGAFIALATSASAAQINSASSWAEIESAGLVAAYPQVQIGNSFVNVNEVCVVGDMLHATVSKCMATGVRGECASSVSASTFSPLARTVTKCVAQTRAGCSQYASEKVTAALEYTVNVYDAASYAHGAGPAAFSKTYKIEACKN
jgi:hypothetical protein